MSQRLNRTSPLALQVGATLLLVVMFALIGFVALSTVVGTNLSRGGANLPYTTPQAIAVSLDPLGTPDPSQAIRFKSTMLGLRLEYPRTWRKNEQGLRVVFSPTSAGLDLTTLDDPVLWVGMPVDGETDLGALLDRIRTELTASSQILATGPMRIGAESWSSMEIRLQNAESAPFTARIAAVSKNQVGYYLVALAPADQWAVVQPAFDVILNSFRFTTEAVLKPTDATPPPTPTPTPTPVFYIIQSGDTPSHIAARYGVTVEALMMRNGLDDPRALRTGAKLIIPLKRRR